jgi:hypothetical protein
MNVGFFNRYKPQVGRANLNVRIGGMESRPHDQVTVNVRTVSESATRTKPLARRTLPRGSTERVQELLT